MKLVRRLCRLMSMPRRESAASRFCSLQTRFNGACPVGCGPEPVAVVGLPFFAVDDGDESPPEGEESSGWPVMSWGEARFDTGGPGKIYAAPGEYTFGS